MRATHAIVLLGVASFPAVTPTASAQVGAGHTPPQTDAEMIANAVSAAPAAVAEGAAVVAFDAKGNIRTLREGTNGFTCIPDDPTNPANDPNCVDANGLEWVKAYVSRTEPPKGKIGFGYMLQGGTTPSNVDPYATEPPAGTSWMQEPPHVMVFNHGDTMTGYPEPGEHADMTRPWVMWAGSPYAHLMLPVK